jgi:starch synthase
MFVESKKVLFISQEIMPYLPESRISNICRYLPQRLQESGYEIRTFMPRFGCINERRNQLHEVIRLSGMNLILNDSDHPLIIKVASIQSARMQVYFIDNEDYFYRKNTFYDENGELFEDNDERLTFFGRGVIETIRKLRWSPDIIHCHGWFSSLIPIFIKTLYDDDPLFVNSKIIFSIYNDEFKGELNKDLKDKLIVDGVPEKKIAGIAKPNYFNLLKLAVDNSEGIVIADNIQPKLLEYIQKSEKPVLQHQDIENYAETYTNFYDSILIESVTEEAIK